jgi:hypothetical protein
VYKYVCVELQPGKLLVVKSFLDCMNPLCDSLTYAMRRKDHTFSLKAKSQKLKWTRKTKNELSGDEKVEVLLEEYETWDELEVANEDIITFIGKAE